MASTFQTQPCVSFTENNIQPFGVRCGVDGKPFKTPCGLEANQYGYLSEIFALGKETLKEGAIPDRIWTRDGKCLFVAPSGMIGVGNAVLEQNPIAAALVTGTIHLGGLGIDWFKRLFAKTGIDYEFMVLLKFLWSTFKKV